jgi:hypothetical protein
MRRYRDNTGNSGVVAYEIGDDFILVQFRDSDKIYWYSYRSAGKRHVDRMKILAEQGAGLSTYVSQHVKDKYESGERERTMGK